MSPCGAAHGALQPAGKPRHGCDQCDAGRHLGEVTHAGTSIIPGSPLPSSIPGAGGRRGFSCKNAARAFKQLKSKCADKAGAGGQLQPPCPGLEGGSRPGAVPGMAVCFGDSVPDGAALSAESAGTAPMLSRRAPAPRLAPTPCLGARSRLRGPRAGGDTPPAPQNWLHPAGPGLSRGAAGA